MKKEKIYLYAFIFIVLIVVIIGFLIIFRSDSEPEEDTTTFYEYEATLNENMINYDLEVIGGSSLSGELYSMDGEWLSDLVDGKAIINEIDYNKYDSFQIKVNGKVYEINKK